jgi:hypothetical protein
MIAIRIQAEATGKVTHCWKDDIMRNLLLVMLILATTFAARADLVADGASSYQIIIPSNAIPSERYAAEELQRYLEKISGAKLPIATDATKAGHNEILLGSNARLPALGLAMNFASLGQEGFTLRTMGQKLIIAGGQPRGTLYGVYAFLEDKLGVRWFTPELESFPKTNRISLFDLSETQVPALQSREVFWTEMMRDGDFAARHRLNGNHYPLTEKHGGRFAVYFPFVHSFDSLIPPELFNDHPEYFPFINGKRINGYVQRCLSNPEVVKLAIARVRQWIKNHPEATIISVSQNDTGKWCQCEQCKAFDDQEGSPAASLIRFVNTIAQDIEKDYPNIRIDTLAYQYTRKPPKSLRPRDNVIIRLCSIECCFAHPLADCTAEENRRFREDITAWEPVARQLYIWDYTPNFAHYQQPFPNFDALQPNVRFFVGHRVKGLFEQGNYSPGGSGEMGPLRTYLLAELLWNPNCDLGKHRREFLAAYFGKAAPGIQEYLDLLESQVRGGKIHAHIYDSPKAKYLNEEFTVNADQILDQAFALADNETVKGRVEVAHLPVWYVELANNRVSGEAKTELLRRFVAVARRAGISHISESQTLDAWAKGMAGG